MAEADGQRWVLAIETSNPSSGGGEVDGDADGAADLPGSGVAGSLLTAGGELGEIIEEPLGPGGRHDDGLMPAVERVRARLGVEPGGLARVIVSTGPGGYTALRVATTTGMLLAEAAGAELIGVATARVAALAAWEAGDADGPVAVCLASKRGVTHATVFDAPVRASGGAAGAGPAWRWKGERDIGLIDESDLGRLGVEVIVADGFLPAPMRLRANDLGIFIRAPRLCGAACLRAGCEGEPVAGGVLLPRYAREPEAVRLWRERHRGPDS